MKSNTRDVIRVFATSLILMLLTVFTLEAFAQEPKKKESQWKEITTVEIPYEVEINVGITKNSNPKYTIDIEDITVYVSPSNYKKFIKKEIVLLLVEWYNPTTGKYKYTTRQKPKSELVKKLNLNELW